MIPTSILKSTWGEIRATFRRLSGPYLLPGGISVAVITGVAWVGRYSLHAAVNRHPAALPSVFTALVVAWGALVGSLWVEYVALRRWWLDHTARITGIAELAKPSTFERFIERLPDPLEVIAAPFLRTTVGARLGDEWKDAGLGVKPSRYLALLAGAALLGYVLGDRIAGSVLGVGAGVILPVLPVTIIRRRAQARRRRFGEQLPQTLDALASGLSAGLSFQQAIRYAADELSEPSAGAMKWLDRAIQFGQPVESALRRLESKQPGEAFALVVDGVILQRQFGGDLVDLFGETAALLRERLELEQEVRAVTAQGQLSSWIIAALVPVSAGILLVFNPRYIDVLFDSLVGQILLVLVMILQLAGWAVISRIARIRY